MEGQLCGMTLMLTLGTFSTELHFAAVPLPPFWHRYVREIGNCFRACTSIFVEMNFFIDAMYNCKKAMRRKFDTILH